MKTTLGGNRLGSGSKQLISTRNFERSTHDLSYITRTTASAGTLIPFMNELALPGDTFDIELDINVMTHPTIGPLFGSYKVQLDVFHTPIRLYNGALSGNKLGIGLDMSKVKLPQLKIQADANKKYNHEDNSQINPSCILSYLNIRGLGLRDNDGDDPQIIERKFNAVPYMIYWDIYKNYYANKQEEIGYVIHNDMSPVNNSIYLFEVVTLKNRYYLDDETVQTIFTDQDPIIKVWMNGNDKPVFREIKVKINNVLLRITDIFQTIEWEPEQRIVRGRNAYDNFRNKTETWGLYEYNGAVEISIITAPKLKSFPLTFIDEVREDALNKSQTSREFSIDYNTIAPYGLCLKEGTQQISTYTKGWSKLSSQEGLGIKTYQSDLFNNWISTEWIDGDNGINAITSVDTTSGSFNIDTLNLANKVYNMLNRIAMSGGSYDDWLDAVYSHDRVRSAQSPVYSGGLIKELTFQEVISLAGSTQNGTEQPLGTLAGKGRLTNKHKGGKIRIKIDEPSYITGIVSLTPRIDYSQGNKWDVNLRTMNDVHKPSLDEIGFQDLIVDQMSWQSTRMDAMGSTIRFESAGKQPAWINYMTNVNQNRGNFADKNQQMWMTLNRRYEHDSEGKVKDLTTYIDPVKFNYIFADTALDAQNFWLQIACDIKARRKMSAKVIPNL